MMGIWHSPFMAQYQVAAIRLVSGKADIWDMSINSSQHLLKLFCDLYKNNFAVLPTNSQFTERGIKESEYISLGHRSKKSGLFSPPHKLQSSLKQCLQARKSLQLQMVKNVGARKEQNTVIDGDCTKTWKRDWISQAQRWQQLQPNSPFSHQVSHMQFCAIQKRKNW